MQLSISKASGSGLTQLPKEEECAATEKAVDFMGYKKVTELSLSRHSSSQIELSLKGNYELTALPPHFFRRMPLLQVLDLSYTSIKALPKSLPRLVSLKSLLLRACQLFMELSPQVGKLRNLEELDLDETEIMNLPIVIGKLAKLRQLRVSFYQTSDKQKSKCNVLIHPETVLILSQLTELSIDVNPADKRWDDLVEAVVEKVCKSMILRTLSLYLPKFKLLDNLSSIYPSLSQFTFIVGHHKRRIIHRVPPEVEAEFRNWDKCLKFVNGENIPVEIQGVLKYSTSFFLDHHSTARSLSDFGVENMRRLRFCLLTECDNMETIIDAENVKDGDPSSLENGMIKSLEYMYVYYMDSLTSVWREPKDFGCVPKLKILALHTCPRLINIFSNSMLENFVHLEDLILEDCPLVTSLVYNASVNPMMSDKFLPNLKRLLLLYLPQLVSICNGLPIAPKLESIGFCNCPKLKSISKMEFSSKSLKIIKGESQWWKDMNWDESEWGNRLDYLMQIFSPINHEQDVMTQMTEDRDHLHCVEDMNWDETDWKPIHSPIPDEHQLSCISCSDYMEDKTTETDVTKPIPSECTFPSTTDVVEQEWSFSSERNKLLKDDEFDVTPKMCEINNDEDEPKAKSLKIIKGESQWWEDMNSDESEWGNRPDYLMQIFSPIDHEQDVMTQRAEDRDHLHCVEDMNWDVTDWKPILSPIPDEHQLSCISCSVGRLGNLYCDPLMASAGHKITARQRWTPTPVQLQILERIVDQGTGTPSKQNIKEITSELNQHGQISETNVYNWFQNRRARSKRKQLIASSNNAESEVQTEVESPNEKKTKPENLLSQQNPAPRADDMCFQNHLEITSELHLLGALSNINSYNGDRELRHV